MSDINKQISILVLASKVQFWSGYNHTDLNNISKIVCLHQQLILNHPCSCLCPSAAETEKPWRTIKSETHPWRRLLENPPPNKWFSPSPPVYKSTKPFCQALWPGNICLSLKVRLSFCVRKTKDVDIVCQTNPHLNVKIRNKQQKTTWKSDHKSRTYQ